jgi:preprotein translocase subunit SecD
MARVAAGALRAWAAVVTCAGAVIVVLAPHASAQPPPWPSIPAQLNLPTDAIELTTDRIQSTLLEVRLAQTEKATNVEEATQFIDAFLRDSGRRFDLHRVPLVTNNDVVQARVVENRGTFGVEVTFSPEASARMQIATSAHYGKQLAIIVNGELVAAPLVQEAVSNHLLISAGFTRNEAQRIASGLRR